MIFLTDGAGSDCSISQNLAKKFLWSHSPSFSISFYFIIITFIVLICWISFYFLDKLRIRFDSYATIGSEDLLVPETMYLFEANSEKLCEDHIYSILFLQFLVSSIFGGALSMIVINSTISYGNNVYQLVTSLRPFFMFTTLVLMTLLNLIMNLKNIFELFILQSFIAIYIIFCAVLNPFAPLVNTNIGSILIIFSWIFITISSTAIEISIVNILRSSSKNKKFMYLFAVILHIGIFCGVSLMYIILNYTSIFQFSDPCEV